MTSIRMPAPRSGYLRLYGGRRPALLNARKYAELEPPQLERAVRTAAQFATTMFIGEAPQPIEILNLSDRGFGARSSLSILIGTQISVELPFVGIVQARVRWGIGNRFGAVFARDTGLDLQAIAAAATSPL
jgi:hypothetical protein